MKIPYALTAAVGIYERHTQMLAAIASGFPRLRPVPIDERKTLHIAAFGPSLQDTWEELRGKSPIIGMSGSTRFLADRGITVDYHCDMDPRPHKWKFIDPPVPGVKYLMASVCHPKTWEILQGQDVELWHAISCKNCTEQFVETHDRQSLILNPGSTIGIAALHLGGVLGYRHFEIHGMDGSFKEGERHAAMHYGKAQKDDITWDAGGRTYRTSRIMANGVAETINQVTHMPVFCVFHGDGLTQALIREANAPNACCADEVEKARRVRVAVPRIVALGGAEGKVLSGDPFEALVECPPEAWVADMAELAERAEARRAQAIFNTGSVSVQAMLYLRALVEAQKPRVVVEVGTFIGRSTTAMQAGLMGWGGHVYTCDKDNDCLPPDAGRTCYAYTTSTAMLADLVAKGLKADLFFFDGRIQPPDLPLILRLSTPTTVYAFDDFTGQEKGAANVTLLSPLLPRHGLVPPPPGKDLTIAILGPQR